MKRSLEDAVAEELDRQEPILAAGIARALGPAPGSKASLTEAEIDQAWFAPNRNYAEQGLSFDDLVQRLVMQGRSAEQAVVEANVDYYRARYAMIAAAGDLQDQVDFAKAVTARHAKQRAATAPQEEGLGDVSPGPSMGTPTSAVVMPEPRGVPSGPSQPAFLSSLAGAALPQPAASEMAS